jgi:long-chain acyl-CoA synthetase
MTSATTLPRLLRRNAAEMPDRPAMREKDRGIWQTYSWADTWREVGDFAAGLAALGFGRADKLSVIGDNRPRLYWAQLAAQCLGGISVPVYQDAIAAELAYVLAHAESRIIVAEDQEQVDKILSLKDKLPRLELIVYDDPRGMRHYPGDRLKSFEEVHQQGRDFAAAHPGFVEAEIEAGTPDDVVLLSYTSGTTGNPKGAMLSHRNLLSVSEAFVAAEHIGANENILCYLPMAWIGDSLFSLALALLTGFTCNCPEGPETVQRDLRELGPTIALAPPRVWETLLTAVRVRAADASWLKRKTFDFFQRLAEQAELARAEGKSLSPATRFGLMLGDFLIYAPVRDQLGLGRARHAYTGGAPLGPETFRFFRGFGVNLKQVWGATELSGVITVQPDHEADPATVGRLFDGVEARITEDGEVLIRCGGVFKGYFKQPEATRETVTEDGWYRTGDSGYLDSRGHLVIIDRAKDVGKLADGTPFAPQFIENKLKFSPYIREAVAFGNQLPFVAAMIAIDMETVGNWAERRNIAYTSFQDLSAKPEVRVLIRDEIGKCNKGLPEAAQIRRFVLLNKDLDADDNEITRTRKIRRRFVAEKYQGVIAALYNGSREVELGTEITYEDGRKATFRSTVAVDETTAEPAAMPAREPAHA